MAKLYNSMKHGDFVQMTLRSKKIYVGLGLDNRNDKIGSNFEYIVILPIISGYRTCSHKVIFTLDYSELYKKCAKKYRAFAWYRLKSLYKKKALYKRIFFLCFLNKI